MNHPNLKSLKFAGFIFGEKLKLIGKVLIKHIFDSFDLALIKFKPPKQIISLFSACH